MKVSVIGSGGWGTALTVLLNSLGNEVTLWSWHQDESNQIKNDHENKAFLPGVIIPEGINYTSDLRLAVESAELLVYTLPSHRLRSYAKEMSAYIKDNQIIVNCTKGLEPGSLKRMSECIKEEIPGCKWAVLSGPSHAEEVARFIPTAVVVSSEDQEVESRVQGIFMSESFRVYTNSDVIGVEMGGALKNVIALCAGMVDGLDYGDNTKAALMTRGLVEMIRLGVAMGAKKETFMGLSGNGDLIVTCTSMHSRNRRAGILLGQGKSLEETLAEIKMLTEGITTCGAAYELAKKAGVEMPIVNEAYKILHEGKSPRQAVLDLMMRGKKEEL
ncbi:MAG: NAD(P)H-dependent glycerol-3-phosphate dehydrogenase [Bacillota bacterium]|nr:NAD(P)H-dependent glycerol-3-phosphate dehydrogenase [Bacillota bacterium]